MSKFFSLNPFRRKKRQVWKKGDQEPESEGAEAEATEPELIEDPFADASVLEEVTLESPDEIDIGAVEAPAPVESIPSGKPRKQTASPPSKPAAPSAEEIDPFEFDFTETSGVDSAPVAPAGNAAPVEDLGEDLGESFEDAQAPLERKPEPPAAVLPAAQAPALEAPAGELRSVRDSVESLKRHAMTAGQLRDTIERTIETRLAGIKDVVTRVQELFRQGTGHPGAVSEAIVAGTAAGERIHQSVAERLSAFERTLGNIGDVLRGELAAQVAALGEQLRGVKGVVEQLHEERPILVNDIKASNRADGAHLRSGIEADIQAATETLRKDLKDVDAAVRDLGGKVAPPLDGEAIAGQIRMQEERVVAWLERLNVASDKEARKAEEDRADLRNILGELLRDRADLGQLRGQLTRVRSNLSAGLQEVREEVWRSFVARSLLKNRVEAALEPAQTALVELDAVLKKLAEK